MKRGKTVKLTATVVQNMGPGLLWDSEVQGLYARRRVAGGPVRYGAKYRFEGDQVWLTFDGVHGAGIDVDAARTQARRKLGSDPTERNRGKDLPTLEEFVEKRYIPEHVETRLSAATAQKLKPRIENKLLAHFGKKRLDQIRTSDVHSWHASLSKKPVEANRSLSLLRHILNAAELWEVIKWAKTAGGCNPTKGVKKYPEESRKVFLSMPQIAALGGALRTLETVGIQGDRYEAIVPNPVAANLYRLTLLTGARPGAIKGVRHEWVDVDEGVIRIPKGKTGFTVIAMPPAARELYRSLPKIKGVPWLFPVQGLNHIVNIWDAWDRVRTVAGLKHVVPHDLRHTFASVGVAGKESLYMVQMLLGHASPQTTQRYAHLAMDPQQEATERIGKKIASALGSSSRQAATDNVQELRKTS